MPPTVESPQKDVKKKLTRVVRALEEKYGPHIYPEEGQSLLEQIVFAILAAKNPVTNARKAIRDFREDYVDWNEVRVGTIRQIEETLEKARIEPTGAVAERIKVVLQQTFDEVCRMSLDALRTDGPEKARKTVAKLVGLDAHEQQYLLVGAGIEEAPPLDPATDRIGLRLGIFAPEDAPAKRRKLLEQHVAATDALRFHHLMVEHGKKLCTEEAPKCVKCPAQGECDWFKAAEVRRKVEEKEKALRPKKAAASAAPGEKKPAPLKADLAKRPAAKPGATAAAPAKAKAATSAPKAGAKKPAPPGTSKGRRSSRASEDE